MKVAVTGAAGQLGQMIACEFSPHADVTTLTRADLDVTDHAAVRAVIERIGPTVIVNCAADNDVDGAEESPVATLTANAFAVRSLARAAQAVGARLIHYSSDFVFDGLADVPYREDDAPNPASVYGASKLLGEWLAREAPAYYVLRVESLFGGPRRHSSVDRIVDAVLDDREAPVFTDRTVSPSYVADVALATRRLLELRAPDGLYHCVNSGMATWYELGQEICRLTGRGRLAPVSAGDVRLPAARPQFCALSNAKLAGLGISLPTWRDALSRYVAARLAHQGA